MVFCRSSPRRRPPAGARAVCGVICSGIASGMLHRVLCLPTTLVGMQTNTGSGTQTASSTASSSDTAVSARISARHLRNPCQLRGQVIKRGARWRSRIKTPRAQCIRRQSPPPGRCYLQCAPWLSPLPHSPLADRVHHCEPVGNGHRYGVEHGNFGTFCAHSLTLFARTPRSALLSHCSTMDIVPITRRRPLQTATQTGTGSQTASASCSSSESAMATVTASASLTATQSSTETASSSAVSAGAATDAACAARPSAALLHSVARRLRLAMGVRL
jgi:hypothetical protein